MLTTFFFLFKYTSCSGPPPGSWGQSACKAPSVEYERPALLCSRAGLPIFLRGIQKYALQPPLPPQTRPFGRIDGQAGRVLKKEAKEIKRQCDLFLPIQARGRVGREIFTSLKIFRRWRDRGESMRPLMPGWDYADLASSASESSRLHTSEFRKFRCFSRITCTAFRCSGSVRRLGVCSKIKVQVSCILAAATSSWT